MTYKKVCDKISHVQQYECFKIIYQHLIDKKIGVDKCLSDEVEYLFSCGIKTSGCCCGRHVGLDGSSAFINVYPEFIESMIDLGYTYNINEFGVHCFKPKTHIDF